METTGALTTSDVARLCAVDATTVLSWIKSGKLKSYHTPGGHNRILKEDLWIFIKENGLPFLGSSRQPDSTKKKILLVDDDPDCLEVVRTGLGGEKDWLIETANNSLDAGLKVGSWKPDLIILDLKMPGFDGIEFCKFLKKTFSSPRLPVIMLTGSPRQDYQNEAILNEVFDYLKKPFDFHILIPRIRQFFAQLPAPSKTH